MNDEQQQQKHYRIVYSNRGEPTEKQDLQCDQDHAFNSLSVGLRYQDLGQLFELNQDGESTYVARVKMRDNGARG